MIVFEIIMLSIVGVLVSIFLIGVVMSIIDRIFKTHYSCTYFGWHNGNGTSTRTFDGCSIHSMCSKCGKKVMQDSQGNWF